MAPVSFKITSATKAEKINVPVITNKVMSTSFHPILAKSFRSFPSEIPANAPNAVAGAINATWDVTPITKSFTGEIGHARSSPVRDTYIIDGSFINWLINLLTVSPKRAIAHNTRIPAMESPTGIL